MAFKVVIKPEAEQELLEALKWYDSKEINLGSELYFEISKLIDAIQENPNLFQKRYKDFRITFTKRFRYGIHYTLEKDIIYIHAILHTSQKSPK
ncbi:hypothetical protein LPB136_10335 [Tenacibaculum todarodis]|uniref:Plasmid stabilization system n=1 Tax=Tenacibaculum todarodis TaxID=1850252 RepID=A0A1L3JKU7_9FLAO|nr:type II toxin-antitoxin system RelE/ParE family toxin [Tenacibaculum todarodis]APG65737.1 hypothetical protein LPB136_10335 [Tenacibaculum todarodis]